MEQQTAPAKAKREYRSRPVGPGVAAAAMLAFAASSLDEPVPVGGAEVAISLVCRSGDGLRGEVCWVGWALIAKWCTEIEQNLFVLALDSSLRIIPPPGAVSITSHVQKNSECHQSGPVELGVVNGRHAIASSLYCCTTLSPCSASGVFEVIELMKSTLIVHWTIVVNFSMSFHLL
jgi:hypothetical protein